MTFEKFANLLFPIIGGGLTTGKFALELFCEIIEYPEELEDDNPLSEQLVSTFKSYFNGTRKIRSLAKKVNQYIETTKFETYIDSFEEGALFNICSSFQDYCPGITPFNVAKKMAELFQSILLEAVDDKKKSITRVNTGDGLKGSYGVNLVIETNCICPNDWCNQSLQSDINGQAELCYEILRIDESKPVTIENLIALCPSCYAKLSQNKLPGSKERLKAIKKQLMQESAESSILSTERIERGIESVLEKILITPDEELVPLNYNPVAIRHKIKADYNPLVIKVKSYVTAYYSKVDQWLKQMDQEGMQHFRPFCNSMKINYLKLSNENLSQPSIFEKLVDWIQNSTNEDRMACEIVVSYFVQKCEVYDVIAE